MDRRNFLRSLVGGVAAAAAVRTWPFRVYSFPSEPVYAAGTWGALSRSSYPGRLCTPTPKLSPNDFIVGGHGFERGSLVAAYDSSGNLCRGAYRVVHVDVHNRSVRLAYEEPPVAPNPIASPLPKLVIDRREQWRQLLKRA